MTGLPKFVREQMASTPAPQTHPDADLLTAFSENALSGTERQLVLDHLSACAECRQIAFLAQPEVADRQAAVLPSRARRFTWMAWASVAVVGVVVGSAVILQRNQLSRRGGMPTVASVPSSELPNTQSPESIKAGPPNEPSRRTAETAEAFVYTNPSPDSVKPAAKEPAGKPIITAEADRIAPPAPPPSNAADLTNEIAVNANVANQQAASGPAQRSLDAASQQLKKVSPAPTTLEAGNIGQPKAEAKGGAGVMAKAPMRPEPVQGFSAASPKAVAAVHRAARAHWRISTGGTLERSFEAEQWSPVLADTGAKFHVVSVTGATVWAGGEGGALYVSNDGGFTWSRVEIGTAGTITSIHFSDANHGSLQTSDGTTWKTSDGGKSWKTR